MGTAGGGDARVDTAGETASAVRASCSDAATTAPTAAVTNGAALFAACCCARCVAPDDVSTAASGSAGVSSWPGASTADSCVALPSAKCQLSCTLPPTVDALSR